METLEKIRKIREEKRKELDLRVNTKVGTKEKHILVCHGTGCTSSKMSYILLRLLAHFLLYSDTLTFCPLAGPDSARSQQAPQPPPVSSQK